MFASTVNAATTISHFFVSLVVGFYFLRKRLYSPIWRSSIFYRFFTLRPYICNKTIDSTMNEIYFETEREKGRKNKDEHQQQQQQHFILKMGK